MINYTILMRNASANSFAINQAKSRIQAAIESNQTPDPEDVAIAQSEVRKAYAQAQYHGVMTLTDFAKYLSNRSSLYSRSDVIGILSLAVDGLRDALLNGQKVQLGEMGNFYVSLKSNPTNSLEEFNSAINIKQVKVKWEPTAVFSDLRNDAQFNFVAPRDKMSQFLRSYRKGDKYVLNDDFNEDASNVNANHSNAESEFMNED
ncbi:MAG: DNA-binding protein [Bacteroidales bacterium]|nr:DNA-binding protein [Bacteroidales bacterium]